METFLVVLFTVVIALVVFNYFKEAMRCPSCGKSFVIYKTGKTKTGGYFPITGAATNDL